MKPTKLVRILITLVSLPFLGGCSHGSGGIPGAPTEPAAITPANATEVAAGMPMMTSLIEFEDFMGFETLTADGAGTFDCPDGGRITAGFAVDAVPLGEVSTGDKFTVDFDNCMLDPSSTINGGIVIDFNTITGDWQVDNTWEVDIGFAINSMTFSSGPVTGFFDGSWGQDVTYDNGNSAYSLVGEFTTSVNDGSGWQTATLSGLSFTLAHDAIAAETTCSLDGQFASTELGGSVTMTTTTPFVIQDGALNPHAGAAVATGAAGSRLTFTVLDETFVRLDVDADGDGIDEFSLTTTWAELEQ